MLRYQSELRFAAATFRQRPFTAASSKTVLWKSRKLFTSLESNSELVGFNSYTRRAKSERSTFSAAETVEADRLASLALLAATQLDRLEHQQPSNRTPIEQFLDAVESFSGADDSLGASPVRWDPTSSEMFSAAVSHITTQPVGASEPSTENSQNSWSTRKPRRSKTGNSPDSLKIFVSIHEFILRNRGFTPLNEKGVFEYEHSSPG